MTIIMMMIIIVLIKQKNGEWRVTIAIVIAIITIIAMIIKMTCSHFALSFLVLCLNQNWLSEGYITAAK